MDWLMELAELLRLYPHYSECMQTLEHLEPRFQCIRGKLSSQERELLDRYISVCEEMDDIMLRGAYELGRRHGLAAARER